MEEDPPTGKPGHGERADWDRWGEIDALFESLLDLEPGDWSDALERRSTEPSVRRTVLRLLHATRDPDSSASLIPLEAATEALEALALQQLPEAIGPFRPLRELGSGGMGTVYLAERSDGDFRLRVAVKVLRRGLDTDHLLARFRAERRILAGLRHPGVAHLLDGGSMPDGRPWLAMEYVEGVPLDTWCAGQGLGERDRVRLVRQVADAVREVHRNLVVHRDIKPSNVLVTSLGAPKLLDFGIAKLVAGGDDPTDADDRTRPDHRILTPRFAAPEQRAGLPVTAATDVYQLGFLLEEILNGSGVGDPGAPGVRGDLRQVIAMATHEDPIRRYRDAGALVEELDRWLEGRPIVARPDTVSYRAARFLQRHRWVAPTAAILAILLTGWEWSVVTGAEALRAERDRARSEAERARLEQRRAENITGFLVELFRSADPGNGERGDTLNARTLLTRGAERIRQGDAVDPAVSARLMVALSEVASALGMVAEAHTWFDDGVALAAEAHGANSGEVAGILHAGANAMNNMRDFARAADRAASALEIRRAMPELPHDSLAATLGVLSGALAELDQAEAAGEAAREAVALHEAGGTVGSDGHRMALAQQAYAARRAGQDDEAEARYRELLTLEPGMDPTARRARAGVLNNLAQLLRTQGRLSEAEAHMRASLEIMKKESDPAERQLYVAFNNLSSVLGQLERWDEALAVARESLALAQATFPESHASVAMAHNVVATIFEWQGRTAEGYPHRASEIEIYTVALGPGHSWTTRSRLRNAAALAALGRLDEARAALDQARAAIPRIDDVSDTSDLEAFAREVEETLRESVGQTATASGGSDRGG
jgi:serine/threonine-protein kinase